VLWSAGACCTRELLAPKTHGKTNKQTHKKTIWRGRQCKGKGKQYKEDKKKTLEEKTT